jgi:hypothetical protein
MAPVIRAYISQISRAQNAIMASHIRLACHQAQPLFQIIIIMIISSRRP